MKGHHATVEELPGKLNRLRFPSPQRGRGGGGEGESRTGGFSSLSLNDLSDNTKPSRSRIHDPILLKQLQLALRLLGLTIFPIELPKEIVGICRGRVQPYALLRSLDGLV